MKLLITILILTSCSPSTPKVPKVPKVSSDNDMVCIKVGKAIYECENYRSVCYKYMGESISCYPKAVQL